jgi:hypothetical protein
LGRFVPSRSACVLFVCPKRINLEADLLCRSEVSIRPKVDLCFLFCLKTISTVTAARLPFDRTSLSFLLQDYKIPLSVIQPNLSSICFYQSIQKQK